MRLIVESVALKLELRPETRRNSLLREVYEAIRLLDLRPYATVEDAAKAVDLLRERFPESPIIFSRDLEPDEEPTFKPEPKYRNRF
ncbi:MAG: hypothetical protein IKU86_06450 [Thermoguttaceae bacterium]|nr:hypothetical protein [Thermoguttaceae bacterium]